MQITGMLWGRKLLDLVEYPHSEVRGPELSVDEIKDMIKRHGEIFIKPVFKGGVGKKGKSGLIGRAKNITDALKEKERLYFAEHHHNNAVAKSDGITYEAAVPADYEVYFSLLIIPTTAPRHDAHPSRRGGYRRVATGKNCGSTV